MKGRTGVFKESACWGSWSLSRFVYVEKSERTSRQGWQVRDLLLGKGWCFVILNRGWEALSKHHIRELILHEEFVISPVEKREESLKQRDGRGSWRINCKIIEMHRQLHIGVEATRVLYILSAVARGIQVHDHGMEIIRDCLMRNIDGKMIIHLRGPLETLEGRFRQWWEI